MTEILDLSLYFILFILILSAICFILMVLMRIFGKPMNKHRSVEKELKKHSSTTDSAGHKDANLTTKDAEANWMNAVMTASFLTASMKNASEHSNTDHDSDSSDAAGHGDSFDGVD
ncbi:hypothetical protein H9I32_28435 [Bacillus sp. Xin]|uniref:hypothetical protein n=1 Tax=unclassified Bacillus (in: firmicutes) TaxID=185979 RepID=UPI001572C5C7|nr:MULTISPECIES: hypothetical protein [unclassified Bacillus (in: firmicutes)]MBC6976151.1 hypothetical protein [Bacillus sp. Xin]NSW37333.1 hypothetical protein [Bacillus sp. Xin1]